MLRKMVFLMAVLCAMCPLLWAETQIIYTASEKLPEVYGEYYNGTIGLKMDAFNSRIISHSFSNGEGFIIFQEDVTTIGNSAFSECNTLISVNIPNSVTSIGDYAFCNCRDLISVNIPNCVTSIGDGAFKSCLKLASVTIPNSVTNIGYSAFHGCRALTSITIPNGVSSIKNNTFRECTQLTSISIPSSVKIIEDYAFCHCYRVYSIKIPNSVITIGKNAFYRAFNIEYSGAASGAPWGARSQNGYIEDCLVYKDGQRTELLGCFYTAVGCINIPDRVVSIGEGAFYYCSDITSLNMPSSITNIGNRAFWCCSGLTSVAIPNGVISIGEMAFYNCSGLQSVTIPNSVMSIGEQSFFGCGILTSVYIPNSVESIGRSAFYDVLNIEYSGNLPGAPWGARCLNGYIENYLVYKDNQKTELLCCSPAAIGHISIPNGVVAIANRTFAGCNTLTSVTIPNSVTTIGNSAFSECNTLTSVTIPNSVTSIGEYAFYGCSALTSVTIPKSVTNIENATFSDCSALVSVIIPNSVASIGSAAFSACTNLQSVTCYAQEPPSLPKRAFVRYEAVLKVPGESIDKYKENDIWNQFANISCIGAEATGQTTEVKTIVGNNEVTITWPTTDGAAAYFIEIFKSDKPFCCLVFNADGVLMNIEYENTPQCAPVFNHIDIPERASQTNRGMLFTITNLDYSTQYTYKIVTTNSSGQELASYQGIFATNGPDALDEVEKHYDMETAQKVFINGRLYLLRNGILYTPSGLIVKNERD